MKTKITKKLMGLALSVFSLAAAAQCPTITNMSITLGANGTATITPAISGSVSPTQTAYYWQITPSATQNSGTFQSQGSFQFPTNGTYTVCLSYADSSNGCWSNQYCSTVNITNMSAASCNASFYFYTDSSCVTHFINTSSGSNLTYNWYINGNSYTSANPAVSLPNGSYTAVLYTSSAGAFCDSTSQYISVSCGGGGTNTPCQASFYTYTDSNCVTYFINTSTGAFQNSNWWINGSSYIVNSGINLANGTYTVGLANYSSSGLCDTTSQIITVACGSGTTTPAGCQANAQFYIFADSTNAGNYFAYNLSWGSGNLTYSWDFGDGTTPSTQQYPFHQYAIPGQYIVCLTVTGTYTNTFGNVSTCSDTYCDSSSVHKMAAGFQMSQVNVIPNTVTGIKQTETVTSVKAFPNPMADELNIEAISLDNGKLNFVLIDALGRTVLTGELNNSKANINTANLAKGFYSLSITNEKGNNLKTIKLVK